MKSNTIPWINSPFFKQLLSTKDLTAEQRDIATKYNNDGYVLLEGFIETDRIDSLLAELGPIFPNDIDEEPRRHQDLWKSIECVKSLATDSEIFEILKMLYDREPVPFQTLNFKYGTEQATHSDTIHFNCLPKGYMSGVWVALEDINEENGGLYYYPGSHKLQEYNYQDIDIPIEEGDYEQYPKYERFVDDLTNVLSLQRIVGNMKKGDVFIWSANLLHGGLAVQNRSRTRWSQVTHYYFEDCIYFTPMRSNMYTGELFLREFQNLKTGQRIVSKANGKQIKKFPTNKSRYFFLQEVSYKILQNTPIRDVIKIFFTRLFKN